MARKYDELRQKLRDIQFDHEELSEAKLNEARSSLKDLWADNWPFRLVVVGAGGAVLLLLIALAVSLG